jgi:Immunity protein 40
MIEPILYRQFVKDNGVPLDEFGIAGVAFERAPALRAVEILRSSAIPILGGDVYLKRQKHLELAYANWHSDPMPGETRVRFIERSCVEAARYIADYPLSDRVPIFGLVLGV